jgi:purine nucleosidase
MRPRRIIIDCDPGVDDAIALLLALASPDDLHVLGITTVAGNVGEELTSRNARIVRQLARREDVPVLAGCTRPMVREPVAARHFHGASGLGGFEPFEPSAPLAPGHAVDFIAETLRTAEPGAVDVVVIGPMTNVAVAMILDRTLASKIGTIVVMGGARSAGGNITASAEYNIFADPHAAHVVFSSGCDIVALGLDATYQVRATPPRIAAIRVIGTRAARAAADLLDFSNTTEPERAVEGAPLHDPCTIAWLLRPELFASRPCYVSVETNSPLTLGHTAVEFRATAGVPMKVRWVTHVDADGVFALLMERLACLP